MHTEGVRCRSRRSSLAATIRDVASLAGVSVSTVSRAFTAPDLVHPATRENVLEAARRLGYRPNRAARGLITGKTGNIGVIVPDLGNPFFPAVLAGIQRRAREAEYAVFLADSGEDPRLERELIHAMTKQVDGVIICSSRMSSAELRDVAEGLDVVLLNRKYPGLPAVLMNSADGMRQALEHLAAVGHRRCAYLGGPPHSWSNRERLRGLRATSQALGLDVVELGPFAPYFEAGMQAADLALAANVTAIVAYNDLMALGVLRRLHERHVAVPGEMSVVGFDDIPMSHMCTPPLTTVAMPAEQAGRAAVGLLLDHWSSHATDGNQQRRLDTQLIIRGSSGPPPSAPSR